MTKSKITILIERADKNKALLGGSAGKLFDKALDEIGRSREECIITLHPSTIDTKVVMPLGDYLLWNFVGKGGPKATEDGIGEWRGSILPLSKGWIVPSYDPGWISRGSWIPGFPLLKWDLERAFNIAEGGWSRYKTRTTFVPRSAKEINEHLPRLASATHLAVDIETPRKQNPNIISCGFADDSTHGVSFIFYPSWFIDGEEGAKAAKDATRDLLASSIPKIMHNGPSFDYLVLEHRGYHVNSFQWDTICAAHQLYAELPRDLGTLTSIYTDQPYHKGMLKEATKDGMHYLRLGEYNALDCMTTYEIAEKQKQELGEEGVKFHQKFYMDLTPPLKEAALDGVRVDLIRLKGFREDVKKELVRVEAVCKTFIPPEFLAPTQQKAIEERRAKIATLRLTGKHLCKDGTESKNYLRHIDKLWKLENADHIAELNMASPLAIKHLLFSKEGFGLRPRREKGKVSTSEKVLNKLVEAKTTPEEIKPFIAGLLDYRGAKKLIDSYLELKPDKDNRVRCVYNLGRTKTGRLSSSKSIFGTGLNLQTIPKRKGLGGLIRSIFLPDEGDVFVKRDLCQAESRVVAYEAGEKRLIELFEGGGDVFRTIGAMAFNKKPEDITNAERAKCKIVEHGGNYGQETAAMAYELSMPLGAAASLR